MKQGSELVKSINVQPSLSSLMQYFRLVSQEFSLFEPNVTNLLLLPASSSSTGLGTVGINHKELAGSPAGSSAGCR